MTRRESARDWWCFVPQATFTQQHIASKDLDGCSLLFLLQNTWLLTVLAGLRLPAHAPRNAAQLCKHGRGEPLALSPSFQDLFLVSLLLLFCSPVVSVPPFSLETSHSATDRERILLLPPPLCTLDREGVACCYGEARRSPLLVWVRLR